MGVDHIQNWRFHDQHAQSKAATLPYQTFGGVQLRHQETHEIILVPTPSQDPNDPLNWSPWYKKSIAVLICIAMLWCNFLAAGPSVAIVNTTLAFFPNSAPTTDPVGFSANIARVAYFFTATALLQGTGNFLWVPLANKYGRRPVYVISYTIYLATALWAIFDTTYGGFLTARIFMGLGAGAAETIAPITISDVFFLHERGAVMAWYTSFLSVGVAFGMIISGLITINHDWRAIYEVAAAFIGAILLAAFFAFPETAFHRESGALYKGPGPAPEVALHQQHDSLDSLDSKADVELASFTSQTHISSPRPRSLLKRQSYVSRLRLFSGVYTTESLVKMFLRPLGLICLPPVLWAALVEGVTIGFLVVVTSNVGSAFETAYHFAPWQIGLCFVAACIGSLAGVSAGGQFGDAVADFFTKHNGGIREPEMRLPAIMPSLITRPLGLGLYGVGMEQKLHWVWPTVGLGLLNFSIVQGTNICLVYVIDAYRPVAGEVTLAVMGFKSLFGFILSFYTNTWVQSSGYQNAYGAMAGISAVVILFWIPLYIWGKKIRNVTWSWPVIASFHWGVDREVGE